MEKASIKVNTSQKRGRISPLVYGSFLEHLGRCIYGGLWAEKIRNGKFAGDDPNHCGVVAPWLPFGERDRKKVYHTHDNTHTYAGRQSQRIEIMSPGTTSGIQQEITVDDHRYQVVCILKGESIGKGVRLSLRSKDTVYAEKILPEIDTEWKTFQFEWTIDPSLEKQKVSFVIYFEGPGTLWIGYVSMMPANKSWKGMRRDVLEAVKALRLATVRWPGGNFVSGYHWMDGIGPREKRPPRWDYAWGAWEPNDFGTDEFIEFCRFVEVEPYLCVNIGTGTPEEAAAWIEYCNGDPSTRYGSLRAENGHLEPYNVRFWGVGNETYGNWQIGHMDPETYGRKCLEFIRAMKATDPNIVLIAVGVNEIGLSSGSDFYPWNERVLKMVNNAIDYLSAHHYAPGPELLRTVEKRPSDEELYYPIVGFPEEMKSILRENIALLDRFSGRKSIDLAYDEWNVWIDGNEKNGLEERYLLRDGLYAAGMLHAFFLFPERIRMTNIAQLVNVLGVISTSETSILLTPLY
ncbi:MAG: alpha-L-arabinofuranosidase C-terminal domain-containing protein, partial [Candidatus Caldatribacteriaceae bacterium]